MRTHLIRIEFENYPRHLPLFNHEAVYKILKGYFHDMKRASLFHAEYADAGPLFLYDVKRGSGIWDFLGELRQLLLYGTTLSDQKIIGQELENLETKLKILKENFGPAVDPRLFENFIKASAPAELKLALIELFKQGLVSVSISTRPFEGDMEETAKSLVDR